MSTFCSTLGTSGKMTNIDSLDISLLLRSLRIELSAIRVNGNNNFHINRRNIAQSFTPNVKCLAINSHGRGEGRMAHDMLQSIDLLPKTCINSNASDLIRL